MLLSKSVTCGIGASGFLSCSPSAPRSSCIVVSDSGLKVVRANDFCRHRLSRGRTFVPKYLERADNALDEAQGPQVADWFPSHRGLTLDNVLILARDEVVAALLGLL